jgi:hypothetical protein
MSQQKVRATLFHAVKRQMDTMSLTAKTAWPNKLFKPPGSLWVNVSYMPGNPVAMTIGELGEDELRGVLQLDINVPSDSGEAEQLAALNTLEQYFIPGVRFVYDSQSVKIHSTARSNGRLVSNDWRVSLSIYFSARYQRGLIPTWPNTMPPVIIGPPPSFP